MNADKSSKKPFKIIARAKFARFNAQTAKTVFKSKSWDITDKNIIDVLDPDKFVLSMMDRSTSDVVKITSYVLRSEYSTYYDIIFWIAKEFGISLPLAMSISQFSIDLPGVKLVVLSKDNFVTDNNKTKYSVIYDYGKQE